MMVSQEDEKTFEKEKHQVIYRAFLDTLKNPENLEKQTKQEIEKKKQKLKEELSDQEKQELQSDLKSLKERLPRLQDENEKKIFTFISKNHESIFNNINKDIKPLSEENFCQLLLSVFEKIREENLASEENLENGEIKAAVDDIRGTEAKDSFIKFVLEMPLLLIGGIKIDPKNISGSFWDGVKEKVPFLGKDKKEEDEPPLSDEEMVTTFLRKSLFPIIVLTTVILLGGLSGPVSALGLFTIPHVMVIGFAVFGLAVAEYKAVKGLFSNDKPGTLYNPNSQDKDDTEKRAKLNGKILDGISEILGSEVNETEQGNQPAVTAEEQLTQKSEQSTMLKQVTLDQQKTTEQQPTQVCQK